MPAQYIADGYVATKTFDGNGFYDTTVVRYRPLTSIESRQLRHRLSEIERNNGKAKSAASIKASEEAAATAIAERLVEWNVQDGGGHEIPISMKSVLGLSQHLNADLLMLLIGEHAPDGEPEPAPELSAEQASAEREQADAKN